VRGRAECDDQVVSRPVLRSEPPYRQIAAQIRARINAGDLRPGDVVPSTRRIAAEWHVAMATATKVLAELKREQLVHVVPGAGTVVSGDHGAIARDAAVADLAPGVSRVITAAVRVADAEGLGAVTMRRVAAELGVGAMSVYRHVPGKAELVRLMADAVFARVPLPRPGPDGWRPRLELVARRHWSVYRHHPWVAGYVLAFSSSGPPLVPHAMDHVEWELEGLAPLDVDDVTKLRAVVSLHCYVGGAALGRALDPRPDSEPGNRGISPARFPRISGLRLPAHGPGDLDGLFEFGLQRHLDGLDAVLGAG
jgi:DNA-binding transcriptional regulator YhcF (GntR family)